MKIFNKKLEKYGFSFDGKKYYNEIQAKTVNMSGRDIDSFVKMLNEQIKKTPFEKIENLRNDDQSKKQILKVLEINEQKLINDLQKEVPVQVMEPYEIPMKISDIIGYDLIKSRIIRQADYIKYSEEEKSSAMRFGVKISKGILLYGPPGNAKTMLAQAIAKDNNFYFIKVLSKDFTAESVSKQLDNLQVIFDQVIRLSKMCCKYEGVLLFFDEFDSLAHCAMNNVIRGTLLDYLASGENQEDSGIRSAQSRVLLMVATNFKELLDPAVIRKGRIDDHLLMDNPSESDGIKMLREKIDRDKSVEIKDVILEDVYKKLKEYVQKQSMVKDDKERTSIRPSGSAIISLFDELKYEAYFNAVESKTLNDTLKITSDIVESHFDSILM
jgi:transitional endoplasmic reticulum ATPase